MTSFNSFKLQKFWNSIAKQMIKINKKKSKNNIIKVIKVIIITKRNELEIIRACHILTYLLINTWVNAKVTSSVFIENSVLPL